MEQLEQSIIQAMTALKPFYSAAYPWQVAAEVNYCESWIRAHMARMAEQGKLYRKSPRGGYVVRKVYYLTQNWRYNATETVH